MRTQLSLIVGLFCCFNAVAQTQDLSAIHFDAVSIKENISGAEKGYMEVPPNGDRLIVRNTPMFRVIGFAFDKQRNDLIEGLPDWTRESHWDIDAVVAPESLATFHKLTFTQQAELLQQILASRCRLVAREGEKEVPVYALTVLKSGLKMKGVPAPDPGRTPTIGWDLKQSQGQIHAHGISMDGLIYALSKAGLSRPVIDRTGLKGRYDIDLSFTPEDALAETQGDNGSTEAPPPSIFSDLQEELGLKLEAAKASVPAVFVSRVDKPSRN